MASLIKNDEPRLIKWWRIVTSLKYSSRRSLVISTLISTVGGQQLAHAARAAGYGVLVCVLVAGLSAALLLFVVTPAVRGLEIVYLRLRGTRSRKPISVAGSKAVSLKERWEEQAQEWIRWARTPGHDSYWRHHRDQFLNLVPAPGRLTVDIGCGEGRLTRDLKARGHNVVGIDGSASLVAAAREADTAMDIRPADAAALPLADASADLAIAFMSLHDVDTIPTAIREIARVLEPGGRLCLAIVHPLNSAGRFSGKTADAPFVISGAYLDSFAYSDAVERDGLTMTFHSRHRPLETYSRTLEKAGLVIEAIREPRVPEAAIAAESDRRWQRLPLFLHVRARRAPEPPERKP